MKNKTLLEVPGYEEKEIVIKKFDYGEKLDLQEASLKVGIIDGKETAEVSIGKLKLNTIVQGIVSAPFFTMARKEQRVQEVRALDPATGDYLYLAIQKFNEPVVDAELKKKSEVLQKETLSETTEQTESLTKQ